MSTIIYWGVPEVLTVSASPAPTTTVFTVSNATNLIEDQFINIQVGGAGNYQRRQITGKTGNQITVSPALSSAPDVPGAVLNGRELLVNDKLNGSGTFNCDDVNSFGDMAYAPAGLKHFVPNLGIYQLLGASGITPDGKYAIDATNSSLEHVLHTLGTDAAEELI
jgi:hypothetical protein